MASFCSRETCRRGVDRISRADADGMEVTKPTHGGEGGEGAGRGREKGLVASASIYRTENRTSSSVGLAILLFHRPIDSLRRYRQIDAPETSASATRPSQARRSCQPRRCSCHSVV